MPYKTDKQKIDDPFLDRRGKLIPCQKERIVQMHKDGKSFRDLAKIFHVTCRAIEVVIFPERNQRPPKPTKEKRNARMNKYRDHKHKILDSEQGQTKQSNFTYPGASPIDRDNWQEF